MKDNKVFMSAEEQAEYDRAIHAFDNLESEETENITIYKSARHSKTEGMTDDVIANVKKHEPEKENDDKQGRLFV